MCLDLWLWHGRDVGVVVRPLDMGLQERGSAGVHGRRRFGRKLSVVRPGNRGEARVQQGMVQAPAPRCCDACSPRRSAHVAFKRTPRKRFTRVLRVTIGASVTCYHPWPRCRTFFGGSSRKVRRKFAQAAPWRSTGVPPYYKDNINIFSLYLWSGNQLAWRKTVEIRQPG